MTRARKPKGLNVDYIDTQHPRGKTRVGHTGYLAWIDDGSRDVHVAKGKCIAYRGGEVIIATDDGDHQLTVPHGRLQWSAAAALDALAADVREEGERYIRDLQETILRSQRSMGDLTRGMMLHLVAIEVAKARAGERSEPGKHLEQAVKRLGHAGDE